MQLRFQACCKRALAAALRLVSRICGETEAHLENLYRQSCSDGLFDAKGACGFDPDELIDDHAGEAAELECADVVANIQNERCLMEPAENSNNDGPDTEEPEAFQENELDVPDREDINKMLQPTQHDGEDKAKDEMDAKVHLPSTLQEAVDLGGTGGDQKFWNWLWRLSLQLRCSLGGIDRGFVRNARNCRTAAKSLNWHQHLGINIIQRYHLLF